MEVMERLIYLFRKFHQLKISNEEYACMKAINFLNQGKNATTSISFIPFFSWLMSQQLFFFLFNFFHLHPFRYQRTVQYLPTRAAEQALLVCVSGLH